jgi:hypothetical protein
MSPRRSSAQVPCTTLATRAGSVMDREIAELMQSSLPAAAVLVTETQTLYADVCVPQTQPSRHSAGNRKRK